MQATFLVLAWEAIAWAKEQRAERPLPTLAADAVEEASASIARPATLWAIPEDYAYCEDPAESFFFQEPPLGFKDFCQDFCDF